jgi:uncharacterized protein YgiM (DUF1202 family)
MNTKKAAGLAALLMSSMLVPAVANAAQATSSVNVRSGPGTNYSVVDTLQRGENVDVDRCQSNGWCYVIKSGPDGWVSARYLTNDDDFNDDDDDRPTPSRPDVNIGFSVPGFSFFLGNGGVSFGDRPNFPGQQSARVCFFEHVNFQGASFCARPGERIRSLGAWNDRISSIDVRGGAEALICEDNGFNGRCVVVSRDARQLGAGNDRISSIRVR